MALVPAKCTNCGGQIEVDSTKEAGICKHCGTAFITEKAINNYTTINNVTNHITKIINGKEFEDGEDFYNRAMSHLKLDEIDEAKDCIAKAIKKNPENSEFRFAEILIETKNLTEFKTIFDSKKLDALLKSADETSKEKWSKETGFDFTKTKKELFVSALKKVIETKNFELVDSASSYLKKLDDKDYEELFKENISYFEELIVKVLSQGYYGDEKKIAWCERLLGEVMDRKIYSVEDSFRLVSFYVDHVMEKMVRMGSKESFGRLRITDDNYKIFTRTGSICVPYQQVEQLIIEAEFKANSYEGLYVTPNIRNYEELGKMFKLGSDALTAYVLDYKEEEKEILKKIYNTKKLKYFNKEVERRAKEKKRLETKSGRAIENVKKFFGFVLIGIIDASKWMFVVLIACAIIFAVFDVVQSNDIMSTAFKWSLLGAGVGFVCSVAWQFIGPKIKQKKIDKMNKENEKRKNEPSVELPSKSMKNKK